MECYRERSPNSSPIPNRHPPYSYTMDVNCHCGQKTPRSEARAKHAKLVKEKEDASALVKELQAKALTKEQEAKELQAKLQLVAVFS